MLNKVTKVVGNVEYITITGSGKATAIYNKQPIVHIKGHGQVIRIVADERGTAIGGQVSNLDDGSWVLYGISKLEELRVDNIKIVVDATDKSFSLGNYNEENNVKIVELNNGSITCPETKGTSLLLWKADIKPHSIGYEGNAKYILSSNGCYKFCKEQLDVIGVDKNLLKKVTYHTSPTMIQFLKDTGITPEHNFYDENISSCYIEMMKAAIAFGVSPRLVWDKFKSLSQYRHMALFRRHIRELMYSRINPDWTEKPLYDEIMSGKLFKLFDTACMERPVVTGKNIWYYKYLLPPIGLDDDIDYVRDALRVGLDKDLEKVMTLFVDKKFHYRDKVTARRLSIQNTRYKMWECGKMVNGIFVYDTKEKLSMFCNTMLPFTQTIRLHNGDIEGLNFSYSSTRYTLSKNYRGIPKGIYVSHISSVLPEQTLSILEDAVKLGIAVKSKDDLVMNYHGNSFYFEVLDYV